MKPAPFALRRPTTAEEAVGLLASDPDAEIKPIAGGQSLVALMNLRLARLDLLVDLNGVPELQYLRVEDGTLRIGAMTRQRTLEFDPTVAAGWPVLTETLPLVAHAPIRNRGTLGGSLAHADPGAELCATCLVLDARVEVRSVRGSRVVPVTELFDGPFMTVLAPDELLAEIVIPPMRPHTGWAFEEVTRRKGDFAMVAVVALLTAGPDGTVADARVGYVSMGANALRSEAAERVLCGAPAGPDTFALAADAAVGALRPTGDGQASADFRLHLAGVLTRRALAKAWDRAVARWRERDGS